MNRYKYTYLDLETSKRKTAMIMAVDLEDAHSQLEGLIIIKINEVRMFTGGEGNPSRYYKYYPSMMHRLGFMLSASLGVVEVLELLISEYKKIRPLSQAFESIKERITGGEALSTAFGAFPNIFDVMVISTISIGEETGQLDKMFLRLSTFYERKSRLNKTVKKSMVQPLLTLSVCIIAFIFIVTSILPKLLSVFMEVGADIPKTTQVMLDISDFFNKYIVLIVLLLIGLSISVMKVLKVSKVKYIVDKSIIKTPILGVYLKNINLAVITSNLGVLLESGVDLQRSLQLVIDITKNDYIKSMLEKTKERIELGITLSEAFKQEPDLFDEVFIAVIRVGESTGGLDLVLGQLSEEYFEIVDNLANTVTTALNFLVMLVMTVIVGVMVVAIYGPIQGLSEGLMNMN